MNFVMALQLKNYNDAPTRLSKKYNYICPIHLDTELALDGWTDLL